MIIILLLNIKRVVVFLGITHAFFGITMYSLIFNSEPINLLFVILGSLIPDIDTRFSKLGKYNPFVGLMKHRGFTHTPLCLIMSSLIIATFTNKKYIVLGYATGYLFHLILDTLTPMGIMWNYPHDKKYYTLSKTINLRCLEGIIFGLSALYIFKG